VFLFLIYADSAALNDPKSASESLLCHSSDECSAKILEIMMRYRFGRSENSNTRVLRGPEQQRIPKVQVECNQGAAFVTTTCNEVGVGSSEHLLASHRCCVMARRLEQFSQALSEIFV
jgi:hypothetical protein